MYGLKFWPLLLLLLELLPELLLLVLDLPFPSGKLKIVTAWLPPTVVDTMSLELTPGMFKPLAELAPVPDVPVPVVVVIVLVVAVLEPLLLELEPLLPAPAAFTSFWIHSCRLVALPRLPCCISTI